MSFHQIYGPQGLGVVGVNSRQLNDSTSQIENFVELTGVTFDVVQDEGSFDEYAWEFGLAPYPRQVLLDGDRRITYLASAHDPVALAAAIEELLGR